MHEQGFRTLPQGGREGGGEIRCRSHVDTLGPHTQALGGGVQVLIGQRLPGIRQVDPYRHPRHRRGSLLEELEGFGDHAGREGRQARDVASRSRQAGHEPAPDGIANGNHDDWDCLRRMLGRLGRRRTHGNEDIYVEKN
jgi:hypothetical protein